MFIFSHFSPSKKSSSRRRTPWVMWRELSRGVAAISAFGTIEEEDGEEMRRDSEMHIFQRESREILGKKNKKTWKRRRVDLQNKPKVSKSDQTTWQVSGYCGSCRNSSCRYVMTGPMTFFAVSLLC